MQTVQSLPTLYKRDSKGKIRVLTIEVGLVEYGFPTNTEDLFGTRSIAGLQEGKLVTSGWKISEPKNVGKINGTTSRTQAESEAQANWDKKAEKEYFPKIEDVDSYERFKPMLAGDYTKRHQSEGFSQPKLDGIRCLADKNGLWTRQGKPINSCPHIWESVRSIVENSPDIVLDGELYNHDLKEDFNKITSLVRKSKSTPEDILEAEKMVEYHVYDMFSSVTPNLLFAQRTHVLEAIIKSEGCTQLVPTTYCPDQESLDAMYGQYMTDGYEGQMVRNDIVYENKRSNGLLKRKEFITEEYEVVSMEQGQGNWHGHTKRFILRMPNGETCGSGVRGKQDVLKALWDSQVSPTWATLRYFGLTPDGVPRFPVVVDYGTGERTD
jgi:DNA ligase-1|tara:strand:+ start:1081 stop:2223 length:1143 start_codon:yes stop_codon:yes gene_type:complete